ncbi:MAG: SRPBCC domain-containing protein [Gemmatimonadales bacterium]
MTPSAIPPLERSVSVSWDPESAFRRFALQFAGWWPWRTHSIGGGRLKRVVFEPHAGGRIFEEHVDGRRFQWGQVLEWEPPRRVKFTFHPARPPETAQEVEVRFVPEGSGTRLELVATGWEKWGRKAQRARRAYRAGWGYVLNVWAGRRTAGMGLLEAMGTVARFVEWLRGGTAAAIARAGGEITPG